MAWLWPWTETVEVVRNTFRSVLDLMREYPDFKFTMSSARTYEWMQEKYPDLFAEIEQRVKEGRWEVIGGMWVEPDLNMPDGESLVRQILVGKRYFREEFWRGCEDRMESGFVRLQLPASADLQAIGHGLFRHPEIDVGPRVHNLSVQILLVAGTGRQPAAHVFSARLC